MRSLSLHCPRTWRAATSARAPRGSRAPTASTACWHAPTRRASTTASAGKRTMAEATCASVPAATPDSTARREWTSARRFPALMVRSSSPLCPQPLPSANSCNWKQWGTTGIGGNLVSIVLHINIRQLSAAACKCHHGSLRLLMKGDKFPSAVQFLRSCKHGGLWDCSALEEQCTVLWSHWILMEMCELKVAPRGRALRSCFSWFWNSLMLKTAFCWCWLSTSSSPCRWPVSDPSWLAYVQLPSRIHRPALRDQHQRMCWKSLPQWRHLPGQNQRLCLHLSSRLQRAQLRQSPGRVSPSAVPQRRRLHWRWRDGQVSGILHLPFWLHWASVRILRLLPSAHWKRRWLPVGSGVPGRGSGGAACVPVHGGLGSEAHPPAGAAAGWRNWDYEQFVQCAERQPDPCVPAEKHQSESQPGGGLRLREIELYP